MAPPNLNVRVSTSDSVMTFKVNSKIKAKGLFDQVAFSLGLRETWFFGLRYKVGNTDTYRWVDMNKKMTKQGIKIEAPDKINLELRFKYYPEDIDKDLIQYVTIKLFYLQLKKDVLEGRTYCPSETAVVLASYVLQIQDGDFDPEVHVPGSLVAIRLLPMETIQKHNLPDEEWEEKIFDFYKTHEGLDREDAMLEYCKVVESLNTYGITYFPITNSKGTKMFLGVDVQGINIYEVNDKLNPKFSFPWSEIHKLKKSSGSLTVKLDKINFVAKSSEAGQIYDLCSGTNDMYKRGRKPDSLEVQQMKNQRMEDKKFRKIEREQLQREIQRRKQMEERSKGVIDDMERLNTINKKMEGQLLDAEKKIEKLELLLKEKEDDKNQLEAELLILKELCEKHKDCEGNRDALISQISLQEEEVDRLRKRIEMKEKEAESLEEEIKETKREDEEEQDTNFVTVLTVNGGTSSSNSSSSSSSSSSASDNEEEEVTKEIKKIAEQEMITPSVQIKVEDYEDALNDVKLSSTGQSAEDKMIDLNKSTLMRELKNRLDDTRNIEFETTEDKIHRDNLRKGRQKFITLKEIRCGTIKRKIEQFEAL